METKTYWSIKTIRNTFLRQWVEEGNLALHEYKKEDLVHADLYEDEDTADLAMSHLKINLNTFMKEVKKEDYPLLQNMGLKVTKVEIAVVSVED